MIFKISIILLTLGQLAWAGAGTIDSGGGFSYYRTSVYGYIEDAKSSLIRDLNNVPHQQFNRDVFKDNVNIAELITIISRLKINIDEADKFRKNPNGNMDLLLLDYRTNKNGEKYIVILKPFFGRLEHLAGKHLYNKDYDYVNGKIIPFIRRLLLHEALHHFGYSENEAFKLSKLESAIYNFQILKQFCENSDCIYVWQDEYQTTLHNLAQWSHFRKTKKVEVVIPVERHLEVHINTHRIDAHLKNKDYQSVLVDKCEIERTEFGTVLCEFDHRLSKGSWFKKSALIEEGAVVRLKNPIYDSQSYLDEYKKEFKPLVVSSRNLDFYDFTQDSYIGAFKIIPGEKNEKN